jgi:serine/threonine protein phosphatase 1
MRTFVISDIHGNNELFREALKEIGFEKEDKLILLGDLIDRGIDSKGVLDSVIQLLESGYNIECLRGNHEQMLLDAPLSKNHLNHWLLNGGDQTLYSFRINSIKKIPPKYLNLINGFKYFDEDENFVFAHAALNMKIADPLMDIDTILWERNPAKYLNLDWLGNRKLIHGHTPTSQAEILKAIENDERIICIDNGSFINRKNYGTMCVLHLESLGVKFCKINR